MNYIDYLDTKAQEFRTIIEQAAEVSSIPTADYGWSNYRYRSPAFRLAHVERYSDDRVEVLHVTTFPEVGYTAPIFGFDIIAVEKKVLGCYLDLSLIGYSASLQTMGCTWRQRKEAPRWAENIFSKHCIFVEPVDDVEVIQVCTVAIHNYIRYLTHLLPTSYTQDEDDVLSAVLMQNKYCNTQATNPRTYNVLKAKLGEQRAVSFLEEILFPLIEVTAVTKEMSYEERYDYWLTHNYETGMEKNYAVVPDFDNSYYTQTPTRKIETYITSTTRHLIKTQYE